MIPRVVNLSEKLTGITEQWSPKIVAEMDGFQFKLVRLEGEFVWHSHAETDEAFFVLEGQLRIEFRNGVADLRAGDLIVVPKDVEHKPVAESECRVLLFEREGTINTGDAPVGQLTANPDARI